MIPTHCHSKQTVLQSCVVYFRDVKGLALDELLVFRLQRREVKRSLLRFAVGKRNKQGSRLRCRRLEQDARTAPTDELPQKAPALYHRKRFAGNVT